ncbi:hypothetical protein UPYG_G00109430 [Umbra pygmaea]|uniref:SPRY-associated domain-containing protein n=1 Tax=Umbra pygmaea TaxID=75934 RepID=A0ABD0X3J4_UMBPY
MGASLQTQNLPLRELDLSSNHLKDRGVKLLCAGPTSPICNIETLVLGYCGLTEVCCSDLASVLRSPNSQLKQLELKDNDLQDSGVTLLSTGLEDPHCKLHTLKLSGCLVTEEGCAALVSALRSNPSHLKELDLSYNHPGDSGVRLLSGGLEDPHWRLEKLNLDHGGEWRLKSGLKKYVCDLTLDPNTVNRRLSLSEENRKVTRSEKEQPYPDHPARFDYCEQVLCREGLTGRCYWEVEWSGGEAPRRVGVYLDWPAGTLSFYSVSSDTVTHLHTFNTTFTEPIHPGFWVYPDSSVSLCQVVPVSRTT